MWLLERAKGGHRCSICRQYLPSLSDAVDHYDIQKQLVTFGPHCSHPRGFAQSVASPG